MTPKTVAAALRQIATKIDASKKPVRHLVAQDLRGLLTRIAQEEQEECSGPGMGATGQEQQGQEQQAMPSSGVGKQMLAEQLKAAQEALEKGDHEGLKKAIENVNKAHR
jgi:hypothetical protein